ncbi:hypothetical protein E6P78_11135 [Streptomyces sp. A0958]|uniref:acyl carrier protein n=1 Tax=Streptomyces sp. A0958 TaxID=2563101 RepID=UPI00109E6326|nr:acyl carrier protein [Streptomyces sp. A0958]THA69984.1 hypothetical protein E6P78_11135 [Streptomyces sp. A0958]
MMRVPPAAASTEVSLAQQWAALPDADRDGVILREARNVAEAVLGHRSGEAIDPHELFTELGFDSLGAVEFRNRLARLAGLGWPLTLIFDHPTAADVAKLVRSRVEEPDTDVVEQEPAGVRGSDMWTVRRRTPGRELRGFRTREQGTAVHCPLPGRTGRE